MTTKRRSAVKVRLLFGSTLALGVLTGAPLFAQSPGTPIPSPNFVSAELENAVSLYRQNSHDEAIAAFSRVLASDASKAEKALAQSRIGYAWLKKGDTEQAKAAWRAVLKDYADQPAYSVDAALRLGNLASKARNLDEALAAFQQAVRLDRGGPETRAFAAEAQTRIGLVHIAVRKDGKRSIDKAAGAFQSVLDNYPDQQEWVAEARLQQVALALEFAYSRRGAYVSAEAAADAFVQDFPHDDQRTPVARLIRAESLIFQERYKDAIAALRDIQTLYTSWPDMVEGTTDYMLALALDRSGDWEQALSGFQRFLDQNKPCFNDWHERPAAQFYVARILAMRGRYEEAFAAFGKVKEDYPNSTFAKQVDGRVAMYKEEMRKGVKP